MNKNWVWTRRFFQNTKRITALSFLGAYLLAVIVSCCVFAVFIVYSTLLQTPPSYLPNISLADRIFALGIILPFEYIVSIPLAFLPMLLRWTIICGVGQILKWNNLVWYGFFGSSLVFLICSTTSFGMVPLIDDGSNFTPSERILHAMQTNGPLYFVMGLFFGATFWWIHRTPDQPALLLEQT